MNIRSLNEGDFINKQYSNNRLHFNLNATNLQFSFVKEYQNALCSSMI